MCELGAVNTEMTNMKEGFSMMYRVTFKGFDCNEEYVECEWTFATRGEADRKYTEVAEFAEFGDRVGFEEIRN